MYVYYKEEQANFLGGQRNPEAAVVKFIHDGC